MSPHKLINQLLLLLLCTTGGFSVASTTDLDQQILERFNQSQTALATHIENVCVGNKENFSLSLWQTAAIHAMEVEGLQLPAAEFLQIQYRFVFWPDSKDQLRRQLESSIAQEFIAEDWENLPASVKSLSAIEYIFIEKELPANHCDWLVAMSAQQLALSNQLLQLQTLYPFDTYEKIHALFGTSQLLYSQFKEILAREDRVIWQLAPGWRSNISWQIQQALLRQMALLLAEFQQVESAASWLSWLEDVNQSASRPDDQSLRTLANQMNSFIQYIEHELSPELDVFLGFNNFDGD